MKALAAAGARLAPESRGALGMLAATFLFVVMDTLAKYLGEHLPPLQVVWARYVGQTVLLMVVFLPSLPRRLRTRAPGLQALRSVLLFGATSLFFTAIAVMPLAEATAVMEISPLLITIMAALVLGERVGPRRWTGVALGLVGALIIIRPGLGVFQPAALLPVAGAVCLASYQIATRMMGHADGIWTTMLYTTLFGSLAASLAMPFVWQTPDAALLPAMLAIGAIGCIGHLCLVWALQQAAASAIAPFAYVQLVWASLFGFVAFSEVPDRVTVLGATVIVGAGIYVWHRERVHAARQRAETARGVAAAPDAGGAAEAGIAAVGPDAPR